MSVLIKNNRNMRNDLIIQSGVCGLNQAYRLQQLTADQVCEFYLQRIERFNPGINAFIEVLAETAMNTAAVSAQRWAEGKPLSVLDGVPLAVKANIAVAGAAHHAGIEAYRDQIADTDAACVARLRAAGAIILGTLNMHEGALGATTDNPWFGRCHNPFQNGLTPGGSSGGSAAAVAAGLCAASLGSDTMGSVRIPSAYCGIVGHKPDRDWVSLDGVLALSPSLDHIGPHARSVRDVRAILHGLADPSTDTSLVNCIGYLTSDQLPACEPAVINAYHNAGKKLKEMGCQMRSVSLADYNFAAMRRAGLLISEREAYAIHENMLTHRAGGFSEEFRSLLEWGHRQSEEKSLAARDLIHSATDCMDGIFSQCQLLMLPTTPHAAFSFEDDIPVSQADYTALANFAGVPAVALPSGVDQQGRPVSIQLLAGRHQDNTLLNIAEKLEQALCLKLTPPGQYRPA